MENNGVLQTCLKDYGHLEHNGVIVKSEFPIIQGFITQSTNVNGDQKKDAETFIKNGGYVVSNEKSQAFVLLGIAVQICNVFNDETFSKEAAEKLNLVGYELKRKQKVLENRLSFHSYGLDKSRYDGSKFFLSADLVEMYRFEMTLEILKGVDEQMYQVLSFIYNASTSGRDDILTRTIEKIDRVIVK